MGLPLAPFERIMRKSGAERVSGDAAEALRDSIEEVASDMASDAVQAAHHAGRKTVKKSDVELASK